MPGKIVHVEFACTDTDRAQRFWSGLFGWEFAGGMPEMDYRMAPITKSCAVAIFSSDQQTPGTPSYYYATDDIDASIARVRELGGQAEERSPVPGHGWYTRCTDSEGNAFRLWQGDGSAA